MAWRWLLLWLGVWSGGLGFGLPVQAQPLTGFADMVERIGPAVVNISTEARPVVTAAPEQSPRSGPPTSLEEFFRNFLESFPAQRSPANSLGSGVIISPDGYLVTNYHVIARADAIKVTLLDDTELTAKVIGSDEKNDLALLKVDAKKPLAFIRLGDSDKVRAGDWVVALGNPFGLGHSVSAGIISARGRDLGHGPYDDFLQTDAAVNPGSSGGALVNAHGELVGINTAIFTRAGGYDGVAFAIPANTVERTVKQLKQFGQPIRGWLGVQIQPVTTEIAAALGLKERHGALVASVTPNSPAAAAGFREGDVILTYQGQALNEMRQLPRLVADTKIGTKAKVEVLRAGQRLPLTVQIAQMPSQAEAAEPTLARRAESKAERATLGLELADLNDLLRQQFMLEGGTKGVVVLGINRRSPAAEANVRVGDVIVQINQQPVATVADVRRLVAADKDDNILLLLNRRGQNLFVAVDRSQ